MQVYNAVVRDGSGNAIPAAPVSIYKADGVTLVTGSLVFGADGVTVIGNPFATDDSGRIACALADGKYVVVVTTGMGTISNNIELFDFDAPPYLAGTVGGSVTIDLSNKSRTLVLTVGSDISALTFSNPIDGAVYNIHLVNVGGHAIVGTPVNFDWGATGAPTWGTGDNLVSCQYLATLGKFRAVCSVGV